MNYRQTRPLNIPHHLLTFSSWSFSPTQEVFSDQMRKREGHVKGIASWKPFRRLYHGPERVNLSSCYDDWWRQYTLRITEKARPGEYPASETCLFFKTLTWVFHEYVIFFFLPWICNLWLVYAFYVDYKRKTGISPLFYVWYKLPFPRGLGGCAFFKLPFIDSYYVPGAS